LELRIANHPGADADGDVTFARQGTDVTPVRTWRRHAWCGTWEKRSRPPPQPPLRGGQFLYSQSAYRETAPNLRELPRPGSLQKLKVADAPRAAPRQAMVK
jgi:hypothetical protein